MNLEDKLRKVREFLAATPAEQKRRLEEEYRERAPRQDVGEHEQVAWHIEMLEEQLSRLNARLFREPPSDYRMDAFVSSLEFSITKLSVEYIEPIASRLANERFEAVWDAFVALVKTVHQSSGLSESAVRSYRLMYLCAYAMGMALNIKAIMQKGLTEDEIAVLSTNSNVVAQKGDLDAQTLSQLLEDVQSERRRLDSCQA